MPETFDVSVVIPAFNMELYLARSIESVLAQAVSAHRIIVVDDGSTDNTGQIAQRYPGKVTYIRQENAGLAAARNTGIAAVSSKFVAFLDADDEWTLTHLANAQRVFDVNPKLMWYAAAYERYKEDNTLSFVRTVDDLWINNNIIEDYFACEAAVHFSSVNVMIVRREVFDEVGGFDTKISQYGEDLDMWYRIALRYPSIGYSSQVAAKYYYRGGSITSVSRIDLPRYINRIQRTEASSLLLGSDFRKLSEPVIRDWVLRAAKECIRQDNKSILTYISQYYGNRLPLKWRLVVLFGKYAPLKRLKVRKTEPA